MTENIDWTFIDANSADNVRELALKKEMQRRPDAAFLLQQISGRQTAKGKIPTWAGCKQIIYPKHLSLEQCSSEPTASYKADIAARLFSHSDSVIKATRHYHFADLTGGFGVDFFFIASRLKALPGKQTADSRFLFVEQQEELCAIAKHNFEQLGLGNVEFRTERAETVADEDIAADILFIDPARRNDSGQRTFSIADCSPDYLLLEPKLLRRASNIMLKLSPMLDYHDTLAKVSNISELHIVGTRQECKELLVVVTRNNQMPPVLFCKADSDLLSLSFSDLNKPVTLADNVSAGDILIEPTPVMMKAAAWGHICQTFRLKKLSQNSHLFVADSTGIDALPDALFRKFRIEGISSMNKRDLRQTLNGIGRANVAVRNFPLSAPELSRRLRLKDGGETYVFGTTDRQEHHIIIAGRKV